MKTCMGFSSQNKNVYIQYMNINTVYCLNKYAIVVPHTFFFVFL